MLFRKSDKEGDRGRVEYAAAWRYGYDFMPDAVQVILDDFKTVFKELLNMRTLSESPVKKIFDDHGEHVFDNYINSIEIKDYCVDTERRTIARLEKE